MQADTRTRNPRRGACALCLALALAPAPAGASEPGPADSDLETLRAQVEALARQNREMQETVQDLRGEVRTARDQARAAEDLARGASSGPAPVSQGGGLLSLPAGSVTLQLLNISLDTLASAGWSSADDEELLLLQGGGHDPRQRGFNLQNVELSLQGAVDPYLIGEAHLIQFLDPEGESRFEMEEAFLQTTELPWGLSERGLQVEFGHFFTEFGRINPQHPHAWHWQDQPLVLSRFFGEDGMRGPGVRVGWLAPLPWFSEVHLGAQNAKGETMVSFLANDEVFEERPIGGRPFAGTGVGSPADLVYLLRWVNGADLSDTWSGQLGLSSLFGPNATGSGGHTEIYGTDLVLKWRPLQTDRGWPFLVFETELLYRNYHADSFFGCTEEEDGCEPVALGDDDLRDWGFYAQLLYGFRRGWAAGLRYDYGAGSGGSGGLGSRSGDPFRDDRQRISPLLVFHPSEFSRLRLQYSYDRADHLGGDDAHSVWAGVEFLFGSHPAHSY